MEPNLSSDERRTRVIVYPEIQLQPLRTAFVAVLVMVGTYLAILFFGKEFSLWRHWEVLTAVMIMVLLIPLFFLHTVLFSHRVVGPVYRLQQGLRRWLEKDYTYRIHLRRGDFFGDLASLFNQLAQRWQEEEERKKSLQQDLEKLVEELNETEREKLLAVLRRHFPPTE